MFADTTIHLFDLLALDGYVDSWALIGGSALPLRGRVRGTRDVDVLVVVADPEPLAVKLQNLGLAHHPRADRHKLERAELLRFWYPVSAEASVGVDVQVARHPFLQRVASRATQVRVGKVTVPVATAEDLILLKLLAFRPIDRADAIEILALAEGLDLAYLTENSRVLGLEERWREVCDEASTLQEDTPSES